MMQAAVLSAVCLAPLGGAVMRQSAPIDYFPPSPPITEAASTTAPETAPPSAAELQTAPTHLLHWVAAEEFPTPTYAMIALMYTDFVPMEPAALCGYYGIDIFPTVPEGLVLRETTWGIFRRGGGTGEIYWDSNTLQYADAVGERHLSVQVDRDILPFDFCNLFARVNERSQIGGVAVGLADNGRGELLAEFMLEGVGFRLLSAGLDREELVEIILSLTANT